MTLPRNPQDWSDFEHEQIAAELPFRRYAIGTRAIITKGPRDFRVVCATCDAGGTVRHETRASAFTAATRDSATACRTCGAA